ncbi:hypothetical protein [Stieleria neptunia]|nr:hypothetical protein [Stieleria neptunia]
MFAPAAILKTFVALVLIAPPAFESTDATVARLRSHGIQLSGRDPCEGTGLHCALLPVYTAGDVCSVFLPRRGYTVADLRTLSRLTNLQHVRSNRMLSEREYNILNASVPRSVWLFCNVRLDDGTLKRLGTRYSRQPNTYEDVNGDGVVDEHDGFDSAAGPAVPPRIENGK